MAENVDVKVLGYGIKIKEKRKPYISSGQLFSLLKNISARKYDRKTYSGKCKKTKDGFLLTMNFMKKLPDTLEDDKIEVIDFWIDKEVDESYHSKDLDGKYGLAKLEDGKIYCHKTHGRFLFKKSNDNCQAIVFLERRHHNVWLSHVFYYLSQFQLNWKFEYEQLAKKSDLMKKLDSIKEVNLICVEDIEVYLEREPNRTISDKAAKERMRRAYPVKKSEFKIGKPGLKPLLLK